MNQRLALLLAASLTGLAASACSGGGPADAGKPNPPPPPSSPAFTEVPSPTGSPAPITSDAPITGTVDPGSVARSGLPTGDARGRMKLALTGLGAVDSDVTGRCETEGDSTTLDLKSSSGAKVVVELVTSGSSVRITDTGLEMGAALLPGDYQVAPPRLTAAAQFQPKGSDLPGGRLDLTVECSG